VTLDIDHDRLVDLLRAFSPVPPDWVTRAQHIPLLGASGDGDGDYGDGSDGDDDADLHDASHSIAADPDSWNHVDEASFDGTDRDDPSGDGWLA